MRLKFNIKTCLDIIDNNILELAHKYAYEIFIAIVSILAFIIRFIFFDIKSADYEVYI